MSPLWSKSLTLYVDVEQLRLHLRPGWLQSRAASGQVLPPAGIQITSALALPLHQALDALFIEMQQHTDIRNARLQVELADAHVHFDVVQGDFAGYSEQQLQAIAQGCVAELLGDAANSQQLRWQLQPDGRHLLLCAIAEPMVGAVVQVAAQHGLRLYSMQPIFCSHWNRHRSALSQGTGVFTLADAGHSLTVCARRGSITALSLGRWAAPAAGNGNAAQLAAQSLDQRVDRLLASLGAQTEALSSFVLVARDPAALAVAARWTVRDWEEQRV